MFNIIAKWILLTIVCVVQLDCKIYQDRPKLKTSDGHLILEPALDKNIHLRPNGDQSSVFIGNIDILKTNGQRDATLNPPSTNEDLDNQRVHGILLRLQVLENKTPVASDTTSVNITMITRRVNNLNRKLITLQNQINNRPKNECGSRPCQHGGTCLNLVDGYHCLCPSNWEGTHCDVDVNECRHFAGTDLGCQNGATCINKPGSYECLCKPTWFGVHCTAKAKDCSSGDFEMCGYGTCVPVTSGVGIRCICHQGWSTNATSLACLTDINECESHQGPRCSVNPKVECVNVPGSFRCGQCPVGYEGDGYICNDIDECTTIRNGGCSPMVACYNTIGSRICGSCPPGYQGDGVTCTFRGSCSINHGGCHSSAQCTELPSPTGVTMQCRCPEGMDGDGMGFAGCYVSTGNYTTGCENNPCGSHGRCHLLRSGYTCICYKGYGGAHCDKATDSCAGNPCQNGGVCRQDTLSGFRCECTAQYSGSLCQVRSETCGGMLDAEEGSIAFPLSNTTLYHNAQCAWIIQTHADKVLNVTFSKFIVKLSPECTGDFLQLHDGRRSSSQLIGRFCGNALPKGGNIVSSHNNLYLWFHSDAAVAKSGFTLHWTSVKPVCGGEIIATTHGHISSPGYPGSYPPNRDCYWHLKATPGKRISLYFFALDIEVHANCNFDYLAIYDGAHTTDPLLSRYCNSTQPAPVQSASSDLLIHFHSDAYGSGNGFQIAYEPIEGIPDCGGYFTADRGEIVAPTYDGLYLNNLICQYKIKTKAETKIKIHFKLFKVEDSPRCRYDYLKIYDGSSSDSPLVGQFCGTTHPATYTSSSNTLYLIFETDSGVIDEGFRITYEAICDKTLLGDSGIIKSPSYPLSYPENKVCVYIIRTEPGKTIQLTFQDFDIEDNRSNDCQYDSVEIRDGTDIKSTLLGRYCGGPGHMPPVQFSTHNYMYVRFESDMTVSGTGFYANYTTVDTECGGIYRDTTGVINHPREGTVAYESDQTCQWLLIAPEGMHIEVTWNRFTIKETPDCGTVYLEIVEINDNSENDVLGKYCGTRSPPLLTTTTNRLEIKLVSDREETYIRNPGFSLSYTFLKDTVCGGTYTKTHGYIHSPGWPQQYERNLDCKWTIIAPVGQQIALSISDFNVMKFIENDCIDKLEIRNGGSDTSPLLGQYCGKFKSKRVTSLANIIHLHFYTNYFSSGTGFSIEWDGTVTGCGGSLTGSTGTITSPNYPNNYHENAECFYRIVTSAGSQIRVSFTELDLGRTPDCRNDYIEIYDGRDTNAPSFGKHCSKNESANIDTTSNYAFIKFRSDLHTNGKGFVLNYITICNNSLTGRYGVIESPGYPNNYPLNLECMWNIQVPRGNRINVTFTHFDIYEYIRPFWSRYNPWHHHPWHHHPWRHHPWRSRYYLFDDYNGHLGASDYDDYNYYDYWDPSTHMHFYLSERCSQDYLQMKEDSETEFSKKMCGSDLPSAISTKGNSFQIQFSSGLLGTPRSGFRLEWVIDGCGGHILKHSGSLSIDKSLTTDKEMECEWLIETPPGNSINITFTDIYMFKSNNCTTDAIEIYNGQNTKAPLLSKICHELNASIQSDSNFMLVRFMKLSILKDVHFSSRFYSTRSKCGGSIKSTSGFLYSRNYPKNYDNNEDCIWYITVPKNHRIEINFIDFDLYSNPDNDISEVRDSCGDSILIYDDNNYSPSSNYTYRICPDSNNTQIVTKYHQVVVQFKSDSAGTAKGFKANFSATCGAVISATQDGIITNNKYINHSNKSCVWTIIAPTLYQKISLTLTHMYLPKDPDVITNRNCPSTFLRVLDGNDNNAPLVGEYCGRKVPPMIVSRSNAITIELGSYTDRMAGQFSVHYSPMLNTCGGTLTAEEGSIASPLYPRPYPADSDCEWVLIRSVGNTAYITFEQFDLGYSDHCNEDYLEFRENDGGGKLLGVYCGSDIPTNYTTAAKMYIKFHSSSRTSAQGFLLHFGYLHENDIQGEYGEIASPLYPTLYEGVGEYNWRISTSYPDSITLTADNLKIPSHGDISYNKLTIYDGYDCTATILEQLFGAIGETKTIQTSSNVVYLSLIMDQSNTGSIFHITWSKSSRNQESSDSKEHINCGFNETELLLANQVSVIKSPNYPKAYRNDLNCEWKYRTQIGRHLSVTFTDFELQESYNCWADSVSIYSAESTGNWQAVKNLCESTLASDEINTSLFMKIKFKTDSSITKAGFRAQVSSRCGGLITDLSGVIGPTWLDVYSNYTELKVKCDWTVKVRPGRTIKVKFIHFNITNINDDCTNSVVLRNGDSVEAPLLASGKYCGYEHEKKADILTSSNALFLSYTTESRGHEFIFQNFKIYYEQENYECGLSSTLSAEHTWEIIFSPNYPSVPVPYSECVWIFTGPPGEVLRIDFIDKFDVDDTVDCATEFIEVRDGSSSLSPSKGRYCGQKPGTIKTGSNAVYIKYSTQLTEPRNGFKANISIDVCGGTFNADSGELTSPGYPQMQVFPYGTVCEWRIIGPPKHTFSIEQRDIDLPHSQTYCATKIDIEEMIPVNETINILKTICAESNEEDQTIETSSNSFTIKLTFGKTDRIDQISENRGFKISYHSSHAKCGGKITTSEGYLTTPNYPQKTTLMFCYWIINVPNKSRRIRLELIDINLEKHSISFTDDILRNTRSSTEYNTTSTLKSTTYKSLGSHLTIFLVRYNFVASHRFKAKFTSDESALCGGYLSSTTQELVSPDLQRAYTCQWHFNNQVATDNQIDLAYNSVFMTANFNSTVSKRRCGYNDPSITIISTINSRDLSFTRKICENPEVSFRIPSSVFDIFASQHLYQSFYFHLKWKLQPCGGIVHVSANAINIINTPDYYNDTLDCAWILIIPDNNRVEIKMEGTFSLKCHDEYLTIAENLDENSPAIGSYCQEQLLESPLLTHYVYMYVQYHSNVKNTTSIRLMARTITHQCGGLLTSYQRAFTSPNYPKAYNANEECTWEIHADLGYRVSLQFIGRFVVEDQPNCTKDVVIIYDWKDDAFEEIAKVCGRYAPGPFNSTYDRLKVVLRTDAETNLDGFKAQWTPICGGHFVVTEKERMLYSPGYPHEYGKDMLCVYELSAPNKEKINLKFLEFELEGQSPECDSDNITLIGENDNLIYVYDIDDMTHSNFYHVFCGTEIPDITRYYENFTLVFRTNTDVQRYGFKVSYTSYTCGGIVNDPMVITASYADYTNCTWVIVAPPTKIVVAKFSYIDLYSITDCDFEYVGVYNGAIIDKDKPLALLCGYINSTTVLTSTENNMVIQFITVTSNIYKGFKAAVYFSHSEAVGCGGRVDLETTSSHILQSPLISNEEYENFLDCRWSITSPPNTVIKITFSKFHIAPCYNVNQTVIGYSKCDCDLVEIKDGLKPTSFVIGSYCGHALPPQLITSANTMSVRLSTDGELVSFGFEATLTVQQTICGESVITVSFTPYRLKSPGYDGGSVPRGVHCVYRIDYNRTFHQTLIRISVLSLQLRPPVNDSAGVSRCLKDRLIISSIPSRSDITIRDGDNFFDSSSFATTIHLAKHLELCGLQKAVDFYVYVPTSVTLITSPDVDSEVHRGVNIEIAYVEYCGRNYTEPQGRIMTQNHNIATRDDCYTLITAPENYTISAYFIDVSSHGHPEKEDIAYLEIFDGDKTNSKRLIKTYDYNHYAVFSTGRYMLIHSHKQHRFRVLYDMNYVTTNKGIGCGGKLTNIVGAITSPFYPSTYRQNSVCEWVLETPVGTNLIIRFIAFDLGPNCEQNYVELVDSKGVVVRTFCSESPAAYTSDDNYVKLVFYTTMNNSGRGWSARFIATKV